MFSSVCFSVLEARLATFNYNNDTGATEKEQEQSL